MHYTVATLVIWAGGLGVIALLMLRSVYNRSRPFYSELALDMIVQRTGFLAAILLLGLWRQGTIVEIPLSVWATMVVIPIALWFGGPKGDAFGSLALWLLLWILLAGLSMTIALTGTGWIAAVALALVIAYIFPISDYDVLGEVIRRRAILVINYYR